MAHLGRAGQWGRDLDAAVFPASRRVYTACGSLANLHTYGLFHGHLYSTCYRYGDCYAATLTHGYGKFYGHSYTVRHAATYPN